jgi:hypothetical protein
MQHSTLFKISKGDALTQMGESLDWLKRYKMNTAYIVTGRIISPLLMAR